MVQRGGGGVTDFSVDCLFNSLSYSYFLIFSHVNLNSLTNKLNYVKNLLQSQNIDVLGISETWLVSEVSDSFISIPGYNLIRADSPSGIRKHGVALYIKVNIQFDFISVTIPNVIVIFLPYYKLYVITIYRPPSYTDIENALLLNFISVFCSDKEVVLQGDFNLPSLHWDLEDLLSVYISPVDLDFLNVFSILGLNQMIKESTIYPSGNILDLFLCSDVDRVGSSELLPPFPRCCHCIVKVSYLFQDFRNSNESMLGTPDRLWSMGKYGMLGRCLDFIDWEYEFQNLDVNSQYSVFLRYMLPLIDKFVPLSNASTNKVSPWPLNPPRSLLRSKSVAWDNYKSMRSLNGRHHHVTMEAWSQFVEANNEILLYDVASQKRYEISICHQLKTSPRLFHSYIKYRKVSKPSIGPLRLCNGDLTDDPLQMANIFVETFASVFSLLDPPGAYANQLCHNNIDPLTITPEMIENILSGLDAYSSMGEDGIHPKLLKSLSSRLAIPLCIIFNNSLQTGRLPDSWLQSNIVPIFKKSSRYDPLNYRPISLSSVVCKSMERIIVGHLMQYINDNHILSDEQYGFRPARSTCDQLLISYDDITKMVDDGKVVDLIFFDFSKAFDRVSHKIPLYKLLELGVSGVILRHSPTGASI